MSTAKYRWWPYVKGMIRDYPALDAKYRELHRVSMTASYSGMPGGGGGRVLENAAIRELPSTEMREYESVRKAAGTATLEQMELVRLCYWDRKPCFLHEAAKRLHISKATAWRWHNAFVMRVAAAYGLLDENGENGKEKGKR